MTSAYRRCRVLWLAFALPTPWTVWAQENSATTDTADDAAPLTLPAAPAKESLLPFYVSPSTTMSFAIDATSVSVMADGVVRFTLVVTSTEGARNVSYEGIRCKTAERKLYATGIADGTWSASRNNAWSQIRDVGANRQYAALYKDYFCDFSSVAGNAAVIVKRIRQKKTLR